MRNLFVAIAISAFALTAQAKEEHKQPSILDVDCNAVIGKAGAKERCFERQKAAKLALNGGQSDWKYSVNHDEMRGTDTDIAMLESINIETLEFPYGKAKGVIIVAGNPKTENYNIILGVEDGQVNCNETLFDGQCSLEYSVDGKSGIVFAVRAGEKNRAFKLTDESGLDVKEILINLRG